MKNQNMFSGYQDESQGDKKSELLIIKILGISSILNFISMMTFDSFFGSKVPRYHQTFSMFIPPVLIYSLLFGQSFLFYYLHLYVLFTGIQLGIQEHFCPFIFILPHISFGYISLILVQSMDFVYARLTYQHWSISNLEKFF